MRLERILNVIPWFFSLFVVRCSRNLDKIELKNAMTKEISPQGRNDILTVISRAT
jgi:hypothetical protein